MFHNLSWQNILSNAVQIIIYAGIVQGFFLAFILTTKKNSKRKSNRILSVLLIVISISILHSVIAESSFSSRFRIREPIILLIGPLLFFYIRAFTGIKPGGVKNYFHFIPFILFFVIILPKWLFGEFSAYSEFARDNSVLVSIIMWALIVIQYGFYWLKSVRMIFFHKIAVESEFSSIEGKTLSWLAKFLHIFGILLILFTGTVIFAIHSTHYSLVDTMVSFGLSCALFVLGYEGLFQEEIFSSVYKPADDKVAKYKGAEFSGTIRKDEELLSEKVTDFFKENKPYLDENLTLTKLAELLEMNRNQLSSVINNKFGCNFYTFVNNYRVEEVKQLLADPKNQAFTILSLAYQSGFPSKSSFQNIFKNITGKTPTEYQKTSGRSE